MSVLDPNLVKESFERVSQEHTEAKSKILGEHLVQCDESIRMLERDAQKADREAQISHEIVQQARRAQRYALETGNFFPLFAAIFDRQAAVDLAEELGLEVPERNSEEWKVPADFQ